MISSVIPHIPVFFPYARQHPQNFWRWLTERSNTRPGSLELKEEPIPIPYLKALGIHIMLRLLVPRAILYTAFGLLSALVRVSPVYNHRMFWTLRPWGLKASYGWLSKIRGLFEGVPIIQDFAILFWRPRYLNGNERTVWGFLEGMM